MTGTAIRDKVEDPCSACQGEWLPNVRLLLRASTNLLRIDRHLKCMSGRSNTSVLTVDVWHRGSLQCTQLVLHYADPLPPRATSSTQCILFG